MLLKVYFISLLASFFSFDLSNGNNCSTKRKITVMGTAIVIKNDAAVRADDGSVYFLDGIFEWEEKYFGKRVKVSGKLVIVEYPIKRRPTTNDSITMTPQRRLGTWKIIKKPKWGLVE
jgi:hypothetical protein